MTKKYNLSSKSDMRKFERDIKNSLLDSARNSVRQRTYDVICPHCKMPFKAKSGKNICPNCKNNVDLHLNINF
ncbi:MAG: hypothetical protein J1E85_10685 [Ruminococcus sp.]|nr:hypothetical protein [Ruminococcus sp.]